MELPRLSISVRISHRWLLLGLLLSSIGCGSEPEKVQQPENTLFAIQKAYTDAYRKLRRPPQNLQELAPFLSEYGEVNEMMTSPNDGKPIVVIWGTNPEAERTTNPLVIAYEQEGVDGLRFVFTSMGTQQMSDEDFANANFPDGHKPG